MGIEILNSMTQAEKTVALAAGKVVIETTRPESITMTASNKDVILVKKVIP